jgi:hypothetical protein
MDAITLKEAIKLRRDLIREPPPDDWYKLDVIIGANPPTPDSHSVPK